MKIKKITSNLFTQNMIDIIFILYNIHFTYGYRLKFKLITVSYPCTRCFPYKLGFKKIH